MGNNQLRNTILKVLLRIDKDQGFSHLLIDHELKSGKIGAKDEGLLTEVVYGTIQRKLTLDYYLDAFVDPKKKIKPWVKMLLRMSLYQMIYLDKIPDHAIIHEAVEIAKSKGHKGIASFVNGVLRSIQRKGVPSTATIKDDVKRISIETSHPEWLVKRWVDQYGLKIAEAMCVCNTQHKPLTVRVQPLKISRDQALNKLVEKGFEARASIFSSQGIIIEKGNILNSELFKHGYVTIQDQTSMLVAEMLESHPNMKVLDACSAPGGKATHIAEKMQNQGELHAFDLHKKKVKLIEDKANQLDLSIIDAKPGDARKLQDIYDEKTFDRVLIDAPCSGLGVIRGKPEIKYHKEEADINRLATIQLEILESVIPLLKDEGLLIYSTCTVDKEENERLVRRFLERNNSYELDNKFFSTLPSPLKESPGISNYGLQVFPQTFNTDGFFLTRMKRKNKE